MPAKQEEYVIENILDMRKNEGKIEYLVSSSSYVYINCLADQVGRLRRSGQLVGAGSGSQAQCFGDHCEISQVGRGQGWLWKVVSTV